MYLLKHNIIKTNEMVFSSNQSNHQIGADFEFIKKKEKKKKEKISFKCWSSYECGRTGYLIYQKEVSQMLSPFVRS